MRYLFKHILMRDAVYGMQLRTKLRDFHRRAAQAIESLYADNLVPYLADLTYHYDQAGEAALTVHYARRAGEHAFAQSAYHEAQSFFRRALSRIRPENPGEQAPLLVSIGKSYMYLGDHAAAAEHLEQGLSLARTAGDRQTTVTALNELSLAAFRQSDYERSQELAQEALATAREIDERIVEAAALDNLGRVAWTQGDHAVATRHYEASLAIQRQIGNLRGVATSLNNLGEAARTQGSYAVAADYHRESLAIRCEIGHRWGIATSLINLGHTAFSQQDYEQAERHYQEALTIYQEIGAQQGIASILSGLGVVRKRQGDPAAAAHYLSKSLLIFRETGDRSGAAGTLDNLGHMLIETGDTHAAWEHLREALLAAIGIGVLPLAMDALVGLANLQDLAGRPTRALEWIGLVLQHPATYDQTKQDADKLLARLRKKVPPEQVEAALAYGRGLELEAVVAKAQEGAD